MLKGKSQMPVVIVLMGILFNVINVLLQGGGLYLFPNPDYEQGVAYLLRPNAMAGILLFFIGMAINLHSDHVVRHLRKPGDTKHYLPKDGFFRFVTSANYFGEFMEWVGFAVLTWSWAGAVFALWTFANLGPRAARIYERYKEEFGEELDTKKVKRMIPFIY